jgi:hypothetical protein
VTFPCAYQELRVGNTHLDNSMMNGNKIAVPHCSCMTGVRRLQQLHGALLFPITALIDHLLQSVGSISLQLKVWHTSSERIVTFDQPLNNCGNKARHTSNTSRTQGCSCL